jgi:hypothetical protein
MRETTFGANENVGLRDRGVAPATVASYGFIDSLKCIYTLQC